MAKPDLHLLRSAHLSSIAADENQIGLQRQCGLTGAASLVYVRMQANSPSRITSLLWGVESTSGSTKLWLPTSTDATNEATGRRGAVSQPDRYSSKQTRHPFD